MAFERYCPTLERGRGVNPVNSRAWAPSHLACTLSRAFSPRRRQRWWGVWERETESPGRNNRSVLRERSQAGVISPTFRALITLWESVGTACLALLLRNSAQTIVHYRITYYQYSNGHIYFHNNQNPVVCVLDAQKSGNVFWRGCETSFHFSFSDGGLSVCVVRWVPLWSVLIPWSAGSPSRLLWLVLCLVRFGAKNKTHIENDRSFSLLLKEKKNKSLPTTSLLWSCQVWVGSRNINVKE